MKLRILPAADAELTAAAQWYEDRSAGLGETFLAEAIDAFWRSSNTRADFPAPATEPLAKSVADCWNTSHTRWLTKFGRPSAS